MNADPYKYGYPRVCTMCPDAGLPKCDLRVEPFLQTGPGPRLMIIGQEPTIYNNPDRVHVVLMLDEAKSQLRRWLISLLGKDTFSAATIYATNVIKCTLSSPPTSRAGGGFSLLRNMFEHCGEYLSREVAGFRPEIVLTLGESAHRLFRGKCDEPEKIPENMKGSFSGEFYQLGMKGQEFRYSPCLHIKTYRVAESYGRQVERFASNVQKILGT